MVANTRFGACSSRKIVGGRLTLNLDDLTRGPVCSLPAEESAENNIGAMIFWRLRPSALNTFRPTRFTRGLEQQTVRNLLPASDEDDGVIGHIVEVETGSLGLLSVIL